MKLESSFHSVGGNFLNMEARFSFWFDVFECSIVCSWWNGEETTSFITMTVSWSRSTSITQFQSKRLDLISQWMSQFQVNTPPAIPSWDVNWNWFLVLFLEVSFFSGFIGLGNIFWLELKKFGRFHKSWGMIHYCIWGYSLVSTSTACDSPQQLLSRC